MQKVIRSIPSFSIWITPNGIFLVQTIGRAYSKEQYPVITAFDDYINVNGTTFILENGNVLYPAIGNGKILENTFYPENYVPQVSGKFLTTLENKLAVFEENKEEMTYVDFQSVEGQLIFFVRGSATYRIKEYWDLIETPEGIIINLPDGIYATNGETRSLISLPINDIMKKNYNSSSIYYNSYEKEVLYICKAGIYVYRFETDSWSKMDFVGPDPKSQRAVRAELEYQKGEAALRARRPELALAHFQAAVDAYPDEGEYHACLGWALYLSAPTNPTSLKRAFAHVQKGRKLAPDRAKPYLFLGRLHLAEERQDVASKMFSRAIQLDPDCLEALRELRLINMRREKSRTLVQRILRR